LPASLAAAAVLDAIGADDQTIGDLVGVPVTAVANLVAVARAKLAALEDDAGDVHPEPTRS
jgi:hypothetical protein